MLTGVSAPRGTVAVRDVLGRPTVGEIATPATGYDNTVLRVPTAYNALSNPYQVSSYNAASGVPRRRHAMRVTRCSLPVALVASGMCLLILPASSRAQQSGIRGYPYSVQINQGQYPYYTSPNLQRTYENGNWVYQYSTSNYAPSSPVATPPRTQEAPNEQSAILNIRVPVENASVWIDGKKIALKGMQHRFESPPLAAGSIYFYKVHVEWMEGGKKIARTEEVLLKAGRASSLRFFGAPAPQEKRG